MPSLTDAPPAPPTTTDENPFPGPTPYVRADANRFFSRGDEIDELTSLVLSTSAVVLDAPSGTGKSSLINAGLIPMLEQYEFTVISVRFGEHAAAMQRSTHVSGGNPFSAAVVAAIADATSTVDLDEPLTGAMARLAAERPTGSLLLLDQFEEIFSNYPAHWSERTPFFRQLAEGLDTNRNLRALLAIRSDFLASLAPYQREIPGQLVVRYNLESLRTDAAAEAVERTFRDSGRPLPKADIAALIDGLLTIWVGDRRLDVRGEFVNLIQLQIVCRGHWEKLAAHEGDRTVDTTGTAAFIDVDRAMDEFVDSAIANTVRVTRCDESVVRQWLESALITPNDRRAVVLVGERETAGLDNAVVDTLQAQRLVASEQRNDERWVELTHDSMIRAVHRSNDRWRRARRGRRVYWRNWLAIAIVVLAGVFVLLRHQPAGSARVQNVAGSQGELTNGPEQVTFTADPNQVMLVSADVDSFSLDALQASPPRLIVHPADDNGAVVAQANANPAPDRSGTSTVRTTFRAPARGRYTAVLDARGMEGATFDLSVTGVPVTVTPDELGTIHDELISTDVFAVALPPDQPVSVGVDNADLDFITGGDILAQGDHSALVVGRGPDQFAVLQVSSYGTGRLAVRTRRVDDESGTLVINSVQEIDSSGLPGAGNPSHVQVVSNVAQYSIESQVEEPVLVGASCSSPVLIAVFDDQHHRVAASGTPETHSQLGRSSEAQEAMVAALPPGRYHAVFANDDYYVDSRLECTIGVQRPGDHTVTAPTATELRTTPGHPVDAFLIKTASDAVVILDPVGDVSPSLRCGPTGATTAPSENGRLVAVVPATEPCVVLLTHPDAGGGSARLRLVEVTDATGTTP
jgi:hypothetical protein